MHGNLSKKSLLGGVPLVWRGEPGGGLPLGPAEGCGDALSQGAAGSLLRGRGSHTHYLGRALGGIGINIEVPAIRRLEVAEGDIRILKRRQVAVEHRGRTHLPADRVLAGDDSIYS